MRGNISVRVIVAAAVIGIVYLGMKFVTWGIQVPEVVMPAWNVKDLPAQLGEWTGKDTKLDERLFQATKAKLIVEREYTNGSGITVYLHLAVFDDPVEGIWHNPMSCYVSAGWNLVESTRVPLSETDPQSDKIALSIWEKSGEKVAVAHWYQLGDIRLYTRWDMGWNVRWQMRGRKTWPALIKILISTPTSVKPEQARAQLVGFAEQIHKWINQPQHQTQDESAGAAPAPPSSKQSAE
jgi:EpsI family protein